MCIVRGFECDFCVYYEYFLNLSEVLGKLQYLISRITINTYVFGFKEQNRKFNNGSPARTPNLRSPSNGNRQFSNHDTISQFLAKHR